MRKRSLLPWLHSMRSSVELLSARYSDATCTSDGLSEEGCLTRTRNRDRKNTFEIKAIEHESAKSASERSGANLVGRGSSDDADGRAPLTKCCNDGKASNKRTSGSQNDAQPQQKYTREHSHRPKSGRCAGTSSNCAQACNTQI